MPTNKSAKKRLRTSEQRRVANRAVKGKVRTLRNAFLDAVQAQDRDRAEQAYNAYCSAMDKALKRNVLKANTVARNKSRSAARLAALSKTS